ncbi:hypothetical protein [Streptomyces sp. NPDC051001]|uniref:hypothetical protein n=1 Tax=Streptomyces sp. NPDC051001 TaxID=3155795 RepID=UPI00342516F3
MILGLPTQAPGAGQAEPSGRSVRVNWAVTVDVAWWSRPEKVSPESIPSLDEDASIELIKDYYSRNLNSSETARTRAQTAFTIISALATLLVGGAAFAGVADQHECVKAAMITAAALWLLATFLYAQAATGTFGSTNTKKEGLKIIGPQAIPAAKSAIALVRTERDLVRWKTKHANISAFLAAIASVSAIGMMWILPPATESQAVVKIDNSGASALAAICGLRTGTEFTATLDLANLAKKYITLTDVASQDCKKSSELTIPTKWVTIVAVRR